MNRKAFTLIEMLVVIVIITMLTVLIVPKVINQVTQKKEEISDISKKLVFDATDLYISENNNKYIKNSGNIYCVTIDNLVKDDKLSAPVKDLKTGREIPLNKTIKVTVNTYNEFEYDLVNYDNCTEQVG